MKFATYTLFGILAVCLTISGISTGAEEEKKAKDDAKAYVVVIKSVEVEKTKADGDSWDINDGAPDLKVIVRNLSQKDSKAFETKGKKDTYSAEYNTPTSIKIHPGQVLEMEVVDADIANNDSIGKKKMKIPTTGLKAGDTEWKAFGRVKRLSFELKALK